MCGGGGGGDGGYGERQDKMKREQDKAIQSINLVFGKGDGTPVWRNRTAREAGEAPRSYDTTVRDANLAARDQLYGTIRNDSEARLLDTLGKDRSKAEREVRFQLARQGLMGGSADIDQGRELLEQFQEGSLEARNAATASANSARGADETTRVNLINNVRSGMAESDALSAAFAGMQNNATTARDNAMATDIGSFFDDISILRARQQYQDGMNSKLSGGGRSGWLSSATSGGNNGFKQA